MPSRQDAPAPSDDDLPMVDASADEASPVHEEEDPNPTILALNEQRIRMVRTKPFSSPIRFHFVYEADLAVCVQLNGSTPTAASFEFKKEDHTLGNALRYIIMKK